MQSVGYRSVESSLKSKVLSAEELYHPAICTIAAKTCAQFFCILRIKLQQFFCSHKIRSLTRTQKIFISTQHLFEISHNKNFGFYAA